MYSALWFLPLPQGGALTSDVNGVYPENSAFSLLTDPSQTFEHMPSLTKLSLSRPPLKV